MMPHIDPVVRFWIGVAITIAIGISGGAVSLTHAVPDLWIPYVTAWASIIAFTGSAVLTALNGMATSNPSRLASAASIPEVKSIVTSQAMADATPDLSKVVGPPKATGTK